MRQEFIQTLRNYVADHNAAQDLGAAMLQCNGMLVPEIAPEIALLITNFPRPLVTNNEAADYNLAGGGQFHVPGAPKNRYDGSVQLIETDRGQITRFAELLLAHGGSTNCIVYDGRPDRFTTAHEMRDCAITFEQPEVDAEGVSTIMRVSGSVKYNYYGMTAALGGSTQMGFIAPASNSGDQLLNRANQILSLVTTGNSLIKAIRSAF